MGEHLGALLGSDVAARCRLGVGSKHLGRAERKRALTPRCSSRWAGAITRTADDMWEREFNNLEDMAKRDRREVSELDRRLALPVGEGKRKKRGYATRSERFQTGVWRVVLCFAWSGGMCGKGVFHYIWWLRVWVGVR